MAATITVASLDRMQRARDEILRAWSEYVDRELPEQQIARRRGDQFRAELFDAFLAALGSDHHGMTDALAGLLTAMSVECAETGLTPSDTAQLVFSLKHVLADLYGGEFLAEAQAHKLIDRMGLHTIEAFIARREQLILRQNQEILDLSVPVTPLWDGILSLPIIGTLDSGRSQAVTEKLLGEIARLGARYAILDITGVPTVDTQTAQHLARTVAAARLMGAECVLTGIRPVIAQTMVSLGINLADLKTCFSLADGLRFCLGNLKYTVSRDV